MFDMTFFV